MNGTEINEIFYDFLKDDKNDPSEIFSTHCAVYTIFFARARNANAKEKINDEPPSLTSQATVVSQGSNIFF